MYKIDLHTHSQASPDGWLKLEDYANMLDSGGLDVIAVTDHGTIDFAQQLHAKLGDRIIVGEEIYTTEGELIGLYLQQAIPHGLSAVETAKAIRGQGGLVYVPHPYERLRNGIPAAVLDTIAEYVDAIEVHNGRASLDAKPEQAQAWARKHQAAMAASSDAHGRTGWGKTYSLVKAMPTRETFVKLLFHAEFHKGSVGFPGRLYPKFNRLRKRLGL